MYRKLKQRAVNFFDEESGPTAVEYAVIIALIIALCITAIGTMGLSTANSWSDSSTKMNTFLNGN